MVEAWEELLLVLKVEVLEVELLKEHQELVEFQEKEILEDQDLEAVLHLEDEVEKIKLELVEDHNLVVMVEMVKLLL